MRYQLVPLDSIPVRERETERLERSKYASAFDANSAARYEVVSANPEQIPPISRTVRYSDVRHLGLTLTRAAAHALASQLDRETECAFCVLCHENGIAKSPLATDHRAEVLFLEPLSFTKP